MTVSECVLFGENHARFMVEITMSGRKAPVLGNYDVVVVGGGFPGVCAAVAASRSGASVSLVEWDGMLGGQAAEIYTFGLDGFFDERGRHFIKGIPWEIVMRTVAEGQSDPAWTMVDWERMERDGFESEMEMLGMSRTPTKSQTYLNPAAFRHVIQTMVVEEGITTFLESPVVDVIIEGDRIGGVVMQGFYGPFALSSGAVVDTTPQAVVAALAGRPFPHPEVYCGTHPRVSGIIIDRLIDHIGENPGEVEVMGPLSKSSKDLREMVSRNMSLLMRGFRGARASAIAENPEYEATGRGDHPYLMFFYDGDGCGTYWIHSTDYRHTSLDDPLNLSRTLLELRKRQWLTHRLFRDYVPGFECAQLVDVHPHIARALVRSHEPSGFTEFDIPREHIEGGGNIYDDSVARVMGHPDAGQSPTGFQIPLRSLIPRGLEGLLVTGKPACRFLHYHGTNAAVGHAAGVAAAIAVLDSTPVREVEVEKVQRELERQGATVY